MESGIKSGIQNIHGVWTVIGCLHQTESVRRAGRLDCDTDALNVIRPHIHQGDTVIDAGANIGTHTSAYLKWVGETGTVLSFEPNPQAFECLYRNCTGSVLWKNALSDSRGLRGLQTIEESPALSYLSEVSPAFTVWTTTIDFVMQKRDRLNFIKIDVEGSEADVLRGGKESICKHKPVMFIEINHEALHRRGKTREEVISIIEDHGYSHTITHAVPTLQHRHDLICVPR